MYQLGYSMGFGTAPSLCTDAHAILKIDESAHAVYTMTMFRALGLSRLSGSAVNVDRLQLIVDDDVE